MRRMQIRLILAYANIDSYCVHAFIQSSGIFLLFLTTTIQSSDTHSTKIFNFPFSFTI